MQSRVKPEIVSRRVRGMWRRHEVTQLRHSSPWFLYDIHFRFYVVTNMMFLFYRRYFLCSYLLRLSSVLFLSDCLRGDSTDCCSLFLYSIISKRKANWIGHILRRNCLIKQVIEGKKKGMEVGRRRKKLLDDLKDRSGYSHLNEETLDRTMWRHRFGEGFTPVRQNTEWMKDERNTCIPLV